MKLVFISYFHGFGGAQKQITIIANAMAKLGHQVTMISLCENKECYEIDARIKKIFIPDSKKGLFKLLDRYNGVKKVLKEEKPDITISFWLQPIYFSFFMSKKYYGKLVYSERCDPSDKQYSGFLGLLRTLSFKKVDGFVFQTSAAKNYFSNDIQNKSIIIPNPVFIKKNDFKEIKENYNRIVSVGRLHKQKNFSFLIETFNAIKDKHPDITLNIYGEGEEKENLLNIIKKYDLSNRVFLMGASKNVHQAIIGSRLFVLSSNYEGMPNALLEAMALGIPCISTNWAPGGIIDIIQNNKNGIIVEPNNIEEMSNAIELLLSNKKLSLSISKEALETAKKFAPEQIFQEWEDFFKKLK